ncbi:MAG: hypothetical protein Q4D57_00740 [Clostridia bacterium]|nr:hypothetical protein [Clostridia bacterium]
MDKEPMENKKVPELIQVKSPVSFVQLTGNGKFCNKLFTKSSMTVLPTDSTEENYRAESLVYSTPPTSDFDPEAFATIIDLLNQLKAATSEQNVFVQNNTVVREQILRQLKNEISKAGNNLTSNQIQNLEVVSSNNFDEQTLTDILKSLLESSKKKSDEKGKLIYKNIEASKPGKISTARIAKYYLKILKNVHHYSKVVEGVFDHVSSKKIIHKSSEKDKPEQTPKEESAKKPEKNLNKIKHVSSEINNILSPKILEEIQESFEKKIVNKLGLISPIVKLQSKISELSVITNVNKIVSQVVERTVPKALKTHTKLINKIVDKSDIEEIKEHILSHEEQYQVDKAVHKRSLDRIYNDIRKVYSAKNISENVFEVLKSSKFRNVNFEEAIKKNLLKVSSKNEVVNRIKNIYEKQVQKSNTKRVVDKSERINRENVEALDTEERLAIEDVVNIRRNNRSLETRFSEQTNLAQQILNNINSRSINYKTLINSIDTISNKTHEQKEILKRIFTSHLIDGEQGSKLLRTEKIDKFIKKHRKLILSDKEYRITEKGEQFTPIYLKDKVINNKEIQNVVEENINKVLSPKVLTENKIKLTTKDIYRHIVTPKITKHIKTTGQTHTEYLVHRDINTPVERYLDYTETPYMVYKEEPKFITAEKVAEEKRPEKHRYSQKGSDTPHIEQIVQPEVMDTKKLEKDIISKTLSKNDVAQMIQSYMRDVNVDTISREVMGRVETKLRMDKRRNGIF